MKDNDSAVREDGAKPARITAKRAGWIALNVVLPAWEVSSVTRHAGRNVSRLWQRLREVTAGRGHGDYRPADWAQAVEDSGQTPERLARNLRISRWIWSGLMWLTGLPVAGFLFALIAAASRIGGTGRPRAGRVLLAPMPSPSTSLFQPPASRPRLLALTATRGPA